jgi:hypothetical protein
MDFTLSAFYAIFFVDDHYLLYLADSQYLFGAQGHADAAAFAAVNMNLQHNITSYEYFYCKKIKYRKYCIHTIPISLYSKCGVGKTPKREILPVSAKISYQCYNVNVRGSVWC